MAIKYSKEFNAEIRRVVSNFNRKRNRAIKRGFTHLPDRVLVSDLKKRYTSRKLLMQELKMLKSFNESKDAALEIVETLGGAKLTSWELQYLRSNIEDAKDFYDRQLQEAGDIQTDMMISKAEYVNNLRTKRAYLDMELMQLSPSQLKTYKRTMDEYLNSNKQDINAYRSWMKEVETIMRHMGYGNDTINRFFDGFGDLTPRQFVTMYRQNSIISRIYELYLPSRDGDFRLSTDEEDAENLLDTFMQQKDEMIAKAKKL